MSHIVSSYDTELEKLRNMIAEMGGISEEMLAKGIESFVERDVELARTVIAMDKKLDALQRDIEERAVLTIARRQPMAVDLRETIASIRISGDLERIGDLAKNLAKRAIATHNQLELLPVVKNLQYMAHLAAAQLKDVLDAYARHDIALAMDVWQRDSAIDTLNSSMFREVLTYMMENPRIITYCTHIMFCSKNIERIGDHTTNIAETVYYHQTGEIMPDERPKMDSTSTLITTDE